MIFLVSPIQIHNYANRLHRFILKCPSIAYKLKLGLFFDVHQKGNPISFKCFEVLQYDRNVFIRFFIESSQLAFLVLTFANFKAQGQDFKKGVN